MLPLTFFLIQYIRLSTYGWPMPDKLKVLFLCTGNSCRSQMAEGWARALKSDVIEAYSAGTDPHGMNPLAMKAMAEAGVDIGRQWSKHVNELTGVPFEDRKSTRLNS